MPGMSSDRLIVGLDIASRTGIAEGVVGEAPMLYSQQFIQEDDDSPTIGFGRAVAFMATRLTKISPVAVVVEGVVPEHKLGGQTNFNASLIKPALYGALTGVARAKGIPVIAANIARVRTFLLGRQHGFKGDEAKRAILRKCQELGWDPPNMDASDAAAVWYWGCNDPKSGVFGLAQGLV